MEQREIEFWARDVRGMAGLTDEDLLTGPEIAVRIVGTHNILLCDDGKGGRLEGRRIIVPRAHPDISHAFAHELAEIVIRDRARFKGTHVQKERAANAMAAAILAPAPTVRRAVKHFGRSIRIIAKAFGLSETSAHLRLCEVLSEEGAVVSRLRRLVMVRNGQALPWSEPRMHAAIVTYALGGGRSPFPGLAKTVIEGRPFERGRVALLVK